uniref:Uncharacterized protein n=1 Tax=Gasterosteus aculeatus TaxID=69293 RepID=G3PQP9_GASAC
KYQPLSNPNNQRQKYRYLSVVARWKGRPGGQTPRGYFEGRRFLFLIVHINFLFLLVQLVKVMRLHFLKLDQLVQNAVIVYI